jgi:hypothetical protein
LDIYIRILRTKLIADSPVHALTTPELSCVQFIIPTAGFGHFFGVIWWTKIEVQKRKNVAAND